MKSPELGIQPLPQAAPPARPALPFPKRASLADLRRLRDRLFREGQHEAALQVAREVASRDPGRESFVKQGMLLREVGRYREALGTLRDALRFETGPAYLVPDIHLHIAHTWFLMGKRKRVGEAVRRAYSMRLKPRTAFNFHQTYGNFLLSRNDYRGALQEYIRAEAAARTALCRGRAAINQGLALLRQWDFSAARGPLDRALRILKKAGHAAELALARTCRAAVYGDMGQYRRALTMFLHAARTFRRLGKVDREAESLGCAGYNACFSQQWAKAIPILDRTISLASATGQHSVLSCAYANRALALANNEDFEKAASSLAQAQRLLRGRRDWIGTLHTCRAQARVAAIVGKWSEVFRVCRRAERVASKAGDAVRVVEFRKLRATAEQHLGRSKASSIARNSAGRLEVLLTSSRIHSSFKIASRLAPSDVPVLILGEAGTDKLEIAREIHRKSGRSKGSCIVVPCEQLIFPASDLCGHTEGAWSGATRGAQGFVTRAQGGTLVLDGVEHLSPEAQRVLIPILDGKARPVGSAEEGRVNLRIVATAVSMETLSPEFRQRLEGSVIRLPALKDQKTEIPHKVEEMLGGRRTITPDALADLARHPWEGNLTELRAAIDRLVALSEGRIGRNLVRKILATTEMRRVARRVHVSRKSRPGAVLAR